MQALQTPAGPATADASPYAPGGGLSLYFALARGAEGAPALDMSKLFDTNYHYLVPELTADSGEQLQAGWVPWAGGGGAAAAGSSRPAMSTCPPTHPPSHTHTHPCHRPAEPCADWSPLLDRVRRAQEVVGADRAVPMVVGAFCSACPARPAPFCLDHQPPLVCCLLPWRRPCPPCGPHRQHPHPHSPAPPFSAQAPTRWWAWPAAPLTAPPWWPASCRPTRSCCASWRQWVCPRCRRVRHKGVP